MRGKKNGARRTETRIEELMLARLVLCVYGLGSWLAPGPSSYQQKSELSIRTQVNVLYVSTKSIMYVDPFITSDLLLL